MKQEAISEVISGIHNSIALYAVLQGTMPSIEDYHRSKLKQAVCLLLYGIMMSDTPTELQKEVHNMID